MKGNYKRSKRYSRMLSHTFRLGAVIAVVFVAVILNVLASSSCNQLVKNLEAKDARLRQCEVDLDRAAAKWDAMRSSENLDQAVCKRGLALYTTDPKQLIRINANGRALPGQLSVALARERYSNAATAGVATPVSAQRRRRR